MTVTLVPILGVYGYFILIAVHKFLVGVALHTLSVEMDKDSS